MPARDASCPVSFRFLQNGQHRIDKELNWSPHAFAPGKPPEHYWNPLKWFWLLPGIYHSHVAGLSVFIIFICWKGLPGRLQWTGPAMGIAFIAAINLYYLIKFKKKSGTHS